VKSAVEAKVAGGAAGPVRIGGHHVSKQAAGRAHAAVQGSNGSNSKAEHKRYDKTRANQSKGGRPGNQAKATSHKRNLLKQIRGRRKSSTTSGCTLGGSGGGGGSSSGGSGDGGSGGGDGASGSGGRGGGEGGSGRRGGGCGGKGGGKGGRGKGNSGCGKGKGFSGGQGGVRCGDLCHAGPIEMHTHTHTHTPHPAS